MATMKFLAVGRPPQEVAPAPSSAPPVVEAVEVEAAKAALTAAELELVRLDELIATGGVPGLRARRARTDAEDARLEAELALGEARATAVLEWDASRKRAQAPAVRRYVKEATALRQALAPAVAANQRAGAAFLEARAVGAPVDAVALGILDDELLVRLDRAIAHLTTLANVEP